MHTGILLVPGQQEDAAGNTETAMNAAKEEPPQYAA